jgi:hypothetical protein
MNKYARILVVGLSAVVMFVIMNLCYSTYIINKTELFFLSPQGFSLKLNLALTGTVNDRVQYYTIPEEYWLDGEYSESYYEGLEKITLKIGREIIESEISGERNLRYFKQITSVRSQ